MSDIQTKYQILAAEYSKLRAQIPILKKAVIDEQSRGQEAKDKIKENDQAIRKYVQEVDSLTFRNQQLASRISFLQEELEESSKKMKNKGSSQNRSINNVQQDQSALVMSEELKNKIEENALLHKQVFDIELQYKEQIDRLQNRLHILEEESSTHQQLLKSNKENNSSIITKLQEEKAMLEVKLQSQENDIKIFKERIFDLESSLGLTITKLNDELKGAKKTIDTKVLFNDTEFEELNCLNVPIRDRKKQLQARELVNQADVLITELTQAFSNMYTYSEQRCAIYPAETNISVVNQKLSSMLHDNMVFLRPVSNSFKTFHLDLTEDSLTTLETVVGIQDFAQKFSRFVSYNSKVLPYFLLSLQEECSLSACPETLVSRNLEVCVAMQVLSSSLESLSSHLQVLASQSKSKCAFSSSCHNKLFLLFSQRLNKFHDSVKELSKQYNAKVSLEHQLPTATQKLRRTDECLVSSLVNLVTCSSKIAVFFAGNLNFFYSSKIENKQFQSTELRVHPVVNDYRQKTANYLSSISPSSVNSVPFSVAVSNRSTLLSSTESRNSLSQQVKSLQERSTKLEKEREHWMLEAQLLQMKYEKECQKIKEMEVKIKKQDLMTGSIEDNLESAPQLNISASSAELSASETKSDKAVHSSVNVANLTSDQRSEESREHLIKLHYSERITDLINDLQHAESKAVNFHAECRALHKRLQLADAEKKGSLLNLEEASQSISQLKDELQTTTRSYEGQLSMMSEHLAGMNEKLAKQKEHIDQLSYQLQNNNKIERKKNLFMKRKTDS